MRILQINIFGDLSTGNIATDIYRTLKAGGHDGVVAFARNNIADDIPYIRVGSTFNIYIDGLLTRITDRAGMYSYFATKKLVKDVRAYAPDVIHLHNLHGYYINVPLLFKYLKESQIPVVWTLHDCWAFTGHCCYFSEYGCEKWKTECGECPLKKEYPASYFLDNSKNNFLMKKALFSGINMTLAPVSDWLASVVKQSFLGDYPLKTIYNGVDLKLFKPTESDFKYRHKIENKIVVLGVASTWSKRKGLDDFIELSRLLPDEFQIVLVGLSGEQMKSVPNKIIALPRTETLVELVGIYTAADVFFNASVEETFGLPTVEAMACGTPTIVYDATALPEVVTDKCGYVVKPHDLENIRRILESKSFQKIKSEDCIAQAKLYEKHTQFQHYVDLYESLVGGR